MDRDALSPDRCIEKLDGDSASNGVVIVFLRRDHANADPACGAELMAVLRSELENTVFKSCTETIIPNVMSR